LAPELDQTTFYVFLAIKQHLLDKLMLSTVTHEIYCVRQDKDSKLYDVRALSLLEKISHHENREVLTFKNPAKAEIVVYKTRKFTDVFYP